MIQSANSFKLKYFCKKFTYKNPANYNKYSAACNGLMYNTFVDIFNKMRDIYLTEANTLNNAKIVKFCNFLKLFNPNKINDEYKFNNQLFDKIWKNTKKELDLKIFK